MSRLSYQDRKKVDELAEKAGDLTLEMDRIAQPFVNEKHPDHKIVTTHIIKASERGDYQLLEAVNEAIDELQTEKRILQAEIKRIEAGG